MTRHQSVVLASLRLPCPQRHDQQNLMSGVDSLHASLQTGRDKCWRLPGRSRPEKPCFQHTHQPLSRPVRAVQPRTESQRSLLGIHPADPGGWKDKAKWILASKNAPLGGCPEFEVPGAAGVGGSLMPQGHEACWASTPHSSMAMPPASPADGCGRRQMGCRRSRGCLGFPQLLQHVDPDSCLLQGRGLPGSGDPQ